MPKGFKEKVRFIEVKPACMHDTRHFITLENNKADTSVFNDFTAKSKEISHKPIVIKGQKTTEDRNPSNPHDKNKENVNKISIPEHDKKCVVENVIRKSEKECETYVEDILKATKSAEIMKIDIADEADFINKTQMNPTTVGDNTETVNERKKKKRKKKKKKKEPKTEICEVRKTEFKEVKEEIRPTEAAEDADTNNSTGRKLPCIFGFISTWIAKRKERRRAKKRKAIAQRQSASPVEQLVEYEHKQAKGGVAFTVEVDSRPMRLPVLPPIKKRTGHTALGADEKQRLADEKRLQELEKRKKPSKEQKQRLAECHERKQDQEFYYRQKVDLTIKHKQCVAKKNRSRIQDDKRCPTPRLRAPSALPPLRNARVRTSGATMQTGSRAAGKRGDDPVEDMFNF